MLQRLLPVLRTGLLLAVWLPGLAWAQPEAPAAYLAELQQRAAALRLADDPMWHKLLHMHRHPLTRRLRSLADDPTFFNAPDGPQDPHAELDATLAAFFDPAPHHAAGQTAQCRFAARHAWLRERLQWDEARLPPQSCERLEAWRAGLDVGRVSLIFPAAYINSPASMYGHTFLRLDPRGPAGDQPLLSYAISYTAGGSEAEGLMFALKGLFGGYPGLFNNWPYYLRIRDYSHLENRDIWEYELDLDAAQIDRLVLHAWELGFTRFDYFFLDENCAYHLLSLIDVARPELDFSRHFTWWAIPADTVRAVVEKPGLVRAQRYRPSNATQLRVQAAGLAETDVAWARDLSRGARHPEELAASGLAASRQAEVLELAERHVAYRAARGEISGEPVERERMALLKARAGLPATAPVDVPVPAAPQSGHRTGRTDLALGRRDGESIWQLHWRAAYHDLMDPEAGYARGAHIQFVRVDLSGRRGDAVELERFIPAEVISLTPYEPLMRSGSWRAGLSVRRTWARAGADPQERELALDFSGGPGYAFDWRGRALAYGLMDNQLWYDPSLGRDRWALGTGLRLGLLWDPAPRWRVHLQAYHRVFLDEAPHERGMSLEQRVALGAQHNLSLRCAREERDGQPRRRECTLGVQRYW